MHWTNVEGTAAVNILMMMVLCSDVFAVKLIYSTGAAAKNKNNTYKIDLSIGIYQWKIISLWFGYFHACLIMGSTDLNAICLNLFLLTEVGGINWFILCVIRIKSCLCYAEPLTGMVGFVELAPTQKAWLELVLKYTPQVQKGFTRSLNA